MLKLNVIFDYSGTKAVQIQEQTVEEFKDNKVNEPGRELILRPYYKKIRINNRRFLGNKYRLLPFIRQVVEKECPDVQTVADVFSGTGSVASAFTDKKLILNDIMYSNYICNLAWLGSEAFSRDKIADLVLYYNSLEITEDNYMSENFADTYFSREDCKKIGFIREDIEERYKAGKLNERERALLITSLLYAMDFIANTCGQYDSFRQGGTFEKHLELAVPMAEEGLNPENTFCCADANAIIKDIKADLVYLDPPYNSRQYCDAYHLLENVAKWEKPEVFGVAKKMDRTGLKSDYCTNKAVHAFADLIKKINAKYILLSYSDTGKADDRSGARLTDQEIMRILGAKGAVKVFSEGLNSFITGSSKTRQSKERLFLCICEDLPKDMIPSAFNYTGGKFKLLPQLLPHFPKKMDRAVDLFCGGLNVGINLNCKKVLFNDSNEKLMGILKTFRKMSTEEVMNWMFETIREYGLSESCEKGYEYYGCDSSKGLSKYNREKYERLRDDLNAREECDDTYYLMLYLLIIYAFNNQIRFNRKGQFNLPVGKRDFNRNMQKKLKNFLDRIHECDYEFTSLDFRDVDLTPYTKDSFFYVDPPYLIGVATYNEQSGWTEKDDADLFAFLDKLHRKGIRFALSNVLESKGKTHEILKVWLTVHPEYKVIPVYSSYANSNYHTKDRSDSTKEVLIVNFE